VRLHRYPGLFAVGAERTLWLAVAASLVLHVALFAAFGRMRIPPMERTFFSPIHMVDLVAAPPGGGPKPAAAPAAPAPPTPAPPAPKPPPKPEPKAPAAPPAPPAKAPPKPPTPAPKPPTAAAKPQPAEKVIPATPADPVPRPEPRTEEQVAERIARMRERIEPRETAPPSPSPARTAMEEAKVSQRVASIRDRIQTGDGGGGAGPPGGAAAVGVRSGSGNVLQEVRLRSYYNRLWEHVNAHWTIPPSLVGRGHTVIVSAVIDRRGRLLNATVEEPSASPAFDQSALRALERAVPLPAFPEEVTEDVLEIGFRFHGD
jgi:TonB family protein